MSASASKDLVIEEVIAGAIKIPGVKVNRSKFLAEIFAGTDKNIQEIIDNGPVAAGCTRDELSKFSEKLIIKRTSQSSVASFVAGIPGGLAMAATIPADVLQFFGMALRLAQELSYIYGGGDLWTDGQVDDEKIKTQLILYCGVMFGVSGAVSGVRVLSTQVAKTTLKKLPQKALTKTVWYPIVKQIGKAIGIKVTKTTVANGISKALPVVGGVISGGLNFISMMPMAKRLASTLDKSNFDYTEEEYYKDIEEMERMSNYDENVSDTDQSKKKLGNSLKKTGTSVFNTIKNTGNKIHSVIEKDNNENEVHVTNPYDELKQLKELLDMEIISQEEFDTKKTELLSKI